VKQVFVFISYTLFLPGPLVQKEEFLGILEDQHLQESVFDQKRLGVHLLIGVKAIDGRENLPTVLWSTMKPNEPLVDPNQQSLISDGTSILTDLKLELDMDSNLSPHFGQNSSNYTKASPAQDALSELFDLQVPPSEDSISNDIMTGDANSLIVDLNDLLKRDPTLSSLSDNNLAVDVASSSDQNQFDFMSNLSNPSNQSGIDIPKNFGTILVPNNSPATWTITTPAPPPNATVIKTELPNGSNSTLFVNSSSTSASMTGTSFQPTLASLNQAPHKMETTDIDLDDIGAFFMKNSSPNVTLGVGPSIVPTTQTTVIKTEPKYFWQASEDSSSFSGTTNPWSTLSSSVPVSITTSGGGVASITTYNTSPLSDILTDLSSTSTSNTAQSLSPNLPSHSPSQAGPTRASTLHKLLMRKDQARTRPSPVRSPEGSIMRPTKTLGGIRSSLSASNPLLSQQLVCFLLKMHDLPTYFTNVQII